MSKFTTPRTLGLHAFLHAINTSGVKMRPILKKLRYLFHKAENLKS